MLIPAPDFLDEHIDMPRLYLKHPLEPRRVGEGEAMLDPDPRIIQTAKGKAPRRGAKGTPYRPDTLTLQDVFDFANVHWERDGRLLFLPFKSGNSERPALDRYVWAKMINDSNMLIGLHGTSMYNLYTIAVTQKLRESGHTYGWNRSDEACFNYADGTIVILIADLSRLIHVGFSPQ